MNNRSIDVVQHFNYLGIMLDENMSWKTHTAMVRNKLSRINGMLHRFMWEEGINTKPQIYYNNNNAGTPQASKRKKKAIQIEKWKTHTQNK